VDLFSGHVILAVVYRDCIHWRPYTATSLRKARKARKACRAEQYRHQSVSAVETRSAADSIDYCGSAAPFFFFTFFFVFNYYSHTTVFGHSEPLGIHEEEKRGLASTPGPKKS